MATIKRESLVDKVYNQLKHEIVFLQRPLGSKLKVSDLEKELKLSCTPIREALNRLQQEGLVTYKTNVGASIVSLDVHDVLEIQQLTSTLHKAAIHLALQNRNGKELATELESALDAMKRAHGPKEEVMAVNRFLGVFYKHSGNSRLDKSMLTVQGQQLVVRNLYAQIADKDRSRDIDCYSSMLEGVKNGDEFQIISALMENVGYMNDCIAAKLG